MRDILSDFSGLQYTCYVIGYVARCLENFLCDQSFWLDPQLLSDLEINVTVDEEHLATLYLGLLLQEGQRPCYPFFMHAWMSAFYVTFCS